MNLLISVCFSWNHGQTCCAGSRIYVQSGIYDKFLQELTAKVLKLKVGDPFAPDSYQGPQISQMQFDVWILTLLEFPLLLILHFGLAAYHGIYRLW
jgi:acyl-CoA reductase-like NAD-dependent aldehyde dehydrogenase